MRKLRWLWWCIGALSLAMLAARHVGARAPDSDALVWLKSLYNAECALPECWQGIRVGETTVRQAVALLQADSAWHVESPQQLRNGAWLVRGYRQAPPHGVGVGMGGSPDAPMVASALWLHLPERALRIGEVIAALGIPDWAWRCRVGSPAFYRIGTTRFMAQPSPDGRLSPHAYVISLNLNTNARQDEPLWQGFSGRMPQSVALERACR